jgi:DNA-binding transcriptional ArsR family regulator
MYFLVMSTLFHPGRKDLSLDTVLSALGDPTRLAIVSRLDSLGETSCGNLGVDTPKSTVSHHLKVLREAGVSQVRQEGTLRYLSLRKEDLDARFPGLLASVLASTKV